MLAQNAWVSICLQCMCNEYSLLRCLYGDHVTYQIVDRYAEYQAMWHFTHRLVINSITVLLTPYRGWSCNVVCSVWLVNDHIYLLSRSKVPKHWAYKTFLRLKRLLLTTRLISLILHYSYVHLFVILSFIFYNNYRYNWFYSYYVWYNLVKKIFPFIVIDIKIPFESCSVCPTPYISLYRIIYASSWCIVCGVRPSL